MCIRDSFLFIRPLYILSAAYSGDLRNGILNSFLSVSAVLIKPGQIKDTLTLYLIKSKYIPCVKLFRAALEGVYPEDFGNPLYPTGEDTIAICPLFLFLK